jgi:hypothetical protein
MLSSTQWGGLTTSNGMTVFVTTLIFQVIAFLAVSLRVWAKRIHARLFATHDYFIFLSFVR